MKKLTEKRKARFLSIALRRSITKARRKMSALERRRDLETRQLARLKFARMNRISLDRNLERQQLILPRILSFEVNYNDTARALIALRDAVLRDNKSVMLHFEHVERIDPSAALALVAEVYRCRNLGAVKNTKAVHGNYPANTETHTRLNEMGFYSLLELEPIQRPLLSVEVNRPIYLKFFTDSSVDAELIDKFVAIIEERQIVQFGETARRRLIEAIIEAMGNANEHAYKKPTERAAMSKRWFLSASVRPSTNEVSIMLFDQGIGIPSTIELSLFDEVAIRSGDMSWLEIAKRSPSDGVLIKAATELFRTGTGQSGRGRGFRDMKRLIDHCENGSLKVLSNFGFYSYIRDQEGDEAANEKFGLNQSSLEGTLLEWNFKSTAPVVMNDE